MCTWIMHKQSIFMFFSFPSAFIFAFIVEKGWSAFPLIWTSVWEQKTTIPRRREIKNTLEHVHIHILTHVELWIFHKKMCHHRETIGPASLHPRFPRFLTSTDSANIIFLIWEWEREKKSKFFYCRRTRHFYYQAQYVKMVWMTRK